MGARARAVSSLFWDPFLYVGLFMLVYLFTQWINGGRAPEYDVNANVWSYAAPGISWLPYSIVKSDALRVLNLFVAVVAAGVCLRNAVGKRAKRYLLQWLCALSGLSALYAVALGFNEIAPYHELISKPESSSVGTLFGFWFIVSIGAYAEALSVRQRRTELVYSLGIVANFCGLLFFAPLPGVILYSVVGVLLLVYAGVYLRGCVQTSFLVKFYAATVLALSVVVVLPLFIFPNEALAAKFALISDIPAYWSQLMATRGVRIDAAMRIWRSHMWFGSGSYGFEHYLGSVLSDASWENITLNKGFVYNDPVQILCEFGLLGSAIIVAIVVVLLIPLCWRAHVAWKKGARDPNAGRSYLIRISPFVFTGVVATLCCFFESFFASPFRMPSIFMSFFIVMLCMPAFLPSR